MRPYNVSDDHGFTILEALIVVVIVGIIFAFSAPSYLAWSQRKKVDSAISSIEGAIKEAQRQAIAQSRTCNVTFDAASSPPQVRSTTSGNCLVTGSRELTGVTLEASPTSLNIDFSGNALTSVTVVVTHTTNTNLKRCLVLSQPLGLIRTGNYTGTAALTDSSRCNS
ncbi:Tfp pilus assembly protein FimT/FimU [Anabaena azotica]|uniref:pilus assembly FimT family protein n=1 Tax=Anabaena azotica TaxID=197653 RepID=UPI0039A583EE